ncbi:hypothetical protein BDR07DRAFT_1312129, partial [Suillus spraguei]
PSSSNDPTPSHAHWNKCPGARGHSTSPPVGHKVSCPSKPTGNPSGFFSGAHGQGSPAVCAVCLGRTRHSFIECSIECIWDKSHPTVSKCLNCQLLIQTTDKPLCLNWQHGQGCKTHSHTECHLCSGCLSASHGAQFCPRTQAVTANLPL